VDWTFVLAVALAVFLVVFVKTEFGLYLVIFSRPFHGPATFKKIKKGWER